MSPVPSPGPDGEQPPLPAGDDDWDAEADLARWLDDIDSGREPVPPEEEPRRPAVMFSLGEAADVDPAELALMAGPHGLAGEVFTQHRAADAMRPGPLLSEPIRSWPRRRPGCAMSRWPARPPGWR